MPPAILIITHHYFNKKIQLEVPLSLILSNLVIFTLDCNIFYQMLQKSLLLGNVPPDPISDLVNSMTYVVRLRMIVFMLHTIIFLSVVVFALRKYRNAK